jgi:hypothetical protein
LKEEKLEKHYQITREQKCCFEIDLDIPILINKKIWRLKVSMHNCRIAGVKVIHSLGLHKYMEI